MQHPGRGCGGLSEKFGDDRTLLLGNGDHNHPGYQYRKYESVNVQYCTSIRQCL